MIQVYHTIFMKIKCRQFWRRKSTKENLHSQYLYSFILFEWRRHCLLFLKEWPVRPQSLQINLVCDFSHCRVLYTFSQHTWAVCGTSSCHKRWSLTVFSSLCISLSRWSNDILNSIEKRMLFFYHPIISRNILTRALCLATCVAV